MATLGKIATKRLYKTSDGSVFETLKEAQDHKQNLIARQEIRKKIIEGYYGNSKKQNTQIQ